MFFKIHSFYKTIKLSRIKKRIESKGASFGTPVYARFENMSYQNKANISIGAHSRVFCSCKLFKDDSSISIGEYSYIGSNTYLNCLKNITIGNHVLISDFCYIMDTDGHSKEKSTRRNDVSNIWQGIKSWEDVKAESICINDDVWIGPYCIILKGVTIGRGSIVAAGSVVTKGFPGDVLIAGNPGKIIKGLA